jgi:hypothetical protein
MGACGPAPPLPSPLSPSRLHRLLFIIPLLSIAIGATLAAPAGSPVAVPADADVVAPGAVSVPRRAASTCLLLGSYALTTGSRAARGAAV